MKKIGSGLVVLFLAMLVNGCGAVIGDADAGPDPGGGVSYKAYINLGRAVP